MAKNSEGNESCPMGIVFYDCVGRCRVADSASHDPSPQSNCLSAVCQWSRHLFGWMPSARVSSRFRSFKASVSVGCNSKRSEFWISAFVYAQHKGAHERRLVLDGLKAHFETARYPGGGSTPGNRSLVESATGNLSRGRLVAGQCYRSSRFFSRQSTASAVSPR